MAKDNLPPNRRWAEALGWGSVYRANRNDVKSDHVRSLGELLQAIGDDAQIPELAWVRKESQYYFDYFAVRHCTVEQFEWLHEHKLLGALYEYGSNSDLLHHAAEAGRADVLDWAHSKIAPAWGNKEDKAKALSSALCAVAPSRIASFAPIIDCPVRPSSAQQTARWLLEHGAGFDGHSFTGSTALVELITMKSGDPLDLAYAQFLLDAGADINGSTSSGYTPLLCTAVGGRLDLLAAQWLIDRGADPSWRIKFDNYEGYWETDMGFLAFVARDASVDQFKKAQHMAGHTGVDDPWVVHMAISESNHSTLRYLLEQGADPNGYTSRRQHHLSFAITRNDMEILRLLLDFGADPNTLSGVSGVRVTHPLSLAANLRNEQAIRMLFDAGAVIPKQKLGDRTFAQATTKVPKPINDLIRSLNAKKELDKEFAGALGGAFGAPSAVLPSSIQPSRKRGFSL